VLHVKTRVIHAKTVIHAKSVIHANLVSPVIYMHHKDYKDETYYKVIEYV